jgi:hypothetical protein
MMRLQPPQHHKPDILLVLVCAVGIAFLVTLSIHAELVQEPQSSSVIKSRLPSPGAPNTVASVSGFR